MHNHVKQYSILIQRVGDAMDISHAGTKSGRWLIIMVLITELIESGLSSKEFLSALVSTIIVRKWLKKFANRF